VQFVYGGGGLFVGLLLPQASLPLRLLLSPLVRALCVGEPCYVSTANLLCDMMQKRQLVRCVDWWLDAVAASAKQKEVNCRNQIHSHLEALAQSHQDSVLAKEEALQIRREAAEVVEACKADSAQLVDTVVQQSAHLAEQAAQLETLHAELHTQEVLCYLAYSLRLTRMRTQRHQWAYMKGHGLQSRPCHSFVNSCRLYAGCPKTNGQRSRQRAQERRVRSHPLPLLLLPLAFALHCHTVSRNGTCPVPGPPSLCTFRRSRAWGLAGICRLRDGWLQNLGTEMDKNLLLLR
jgi:hypothetical protein